MSQPATSSSSSSSSSTATSASGTANTENVTQKLPLFADIGKTARELFEKNFHMDVIDMKMTSGLNSKMCYEATQKYSLQDKKMKGECEVRYYNWNMIFKPKITTDSVISGEIRVDRPEFKGASLLLNGSYNVPTGQKSYLFGATLRNPDYTIELANVQNDPELKPNGSLMKCTGVVNLWGWIFGGSFFSDLNEAKFVKTQLIGGFNDGRTSFFVSCDPTNKTVNGSIYNNVNERVQTALVYSIGKESNKKSLPAPPGTAKDNSPTLGFASSYRLNNGAMVKGRINSDYLVGLSYILTMKPGMMLTMCTEIDVGKLKQGGHKVGFGLEFS